MTEHRGNVLCKSCFSNKCKSVGVVDVDDDYVAVAAAH